MIEMLVALTITAFILLFMSSTIIQLLVISKQNSSLITAQRQVQQVGFYLSRDAQQARTVKMGNSPAGTGFPVEYTWFDLDGYKHVVTFALSGSGVVSRSELVNGATTTFNIASNISTSASETVFSKVLPLDPSDGGYNLKVTARITGKITAVETREYQILQRTS
jgi:hypothetical protein